MVMINLLRIAGIAVLLGHLIVNPTQAQTRTFYKEPAWKPRAILPYEDAIKDNFWPKSPAVNNSYLDPGFVEERLGKVPPPGVHPRVLMNPSDLESIRAKIALGDKAPKSFQVMWQRVSRNRNAFYALVTKDDALGKDLARRLVQNIKSLEPKLDMMDKQTDSGNLWAVERTIIALGEPDPPTEIWSLLDYDYLSGWMTKEERELARKVIARITTRRISNFLTVPDHFMINNHQGFGMEYIRLMLLIEGEEGFNRELFDLACHKANAMLDWFLDDDGMCAESIKGWLNVSALVAVGQRQRNLLKHDHLRAKMRFFQAALRWENNSWMIRDEMRASAFHVIWMMHYYHPKDEGIDFLYKASFSTHRFLTDADSRWPDPVGISPELLLLYADDGMTGKDGKPLAWEDQERINSLKLPLTWKDDVRGYVETRNSWNKNDLNVGFVCKQDFFYGGHEGSENNRLTLWKDGVNWIRDNNMLATKATFLQNMLTIDGQGCHWPPAPGTWLGVQETPQGVIASGDGKNGYSFYKSMQVHPLFFPSSKVPYYAPFAEGNFDLSRDLQVAFHPGTIKWNDGYAHTDYGPWSGETRLVENYRQWNTMEQAYRTVQVARGENPYVLVIDDARKDGQVHNFEWNISVPMDVDLVDAVTPEIVYQNTEPSGIRVDDIILGKKSSANSTRDGRPQFQKGEPLCLIRVLWRNANYGFPVPGFQKFQGYNQVTIPARSESPEFRVLIYPYRYGDPLPITTWNKDRTELTVKIKNQTDVYNFGKADGGRTVLSMVREGKEVLNSMAKPARPVLLVRGSRFDINDLRYTRDENKIPSYLVDQSEEVQIVRPAAPVQIRYTLDGTEPTETSLLYDITVPITKTCDLKAATFDPNWVCGPKKSDIITARFVVKEAAKGITEASDINTNGLIVRVYEKNTKLYNDKGFFNASGIMMPDLNMEKPTLVTTVNGFTLPLVTPGELMEQQSKGFYRFTGLFYAKERGVYRFDVNSCGPVTLDIAKQTVIESIGVFHQQQAHRKGEALLDKGWHNIELVVCDPLFWNINSLNPMPLEVTYNINGGTEQTVSDSQLRYKNEAGLVMEPQPEMKWHEAADIRVRMEPGFDLQMYDRTGKRRDKDFLDIDGLLPLRSERTQEMESGESRNMVKCYSGFFYAPISGIYNFKLAGSEGESAGLGARQASCQNQLKIGNEYVVQRGVYGRNPSGIIGLKKGWHPISIRFGPSETTCKVVLPDGQTIQITGNTIFRNTLVSVSMDENPVRQNPQEIYQPVKVSLSLPGNPKTEIRYTLDGSAPVQGSPVYSTPIAIDKSTILTAAAFVDGHSVTAPVTSEFKLVEIPQSGSLGNIDFANWDGKSGNYPVAAGFQLWIAGGCTIAEGMKGKALEMKTGVSGNQPGIDVNVSRGSSKAGLKMHHLIMRDNALTIALWFKTDELSGKLFGKDGYNAFGKGYKTLSCSMDNGRITASPGRLAGGKIEPNVWQFAVLSASEKQMDLYLNGEKVASGPGTRDITTDALDFFVGHSAVLSGLQVFDRLLEPLEVKRLYEFGKKRE
jgi:hypothetical protein